MADRTEILADARLMITQCVAGIVDKHSSVTVAELTMLLADAAAHWADRAVRREHWAKERSAELEG